MEEALLIKSNENLLIARNLWIDKKYHRAISTYYYSIIQLIKYKLIFEAGVKNNELRGVNSHIILYQTFLKKYDVKGLFDFKSAKKKRIIADYNNSLPDNDIKVKLFFEDLRNKVLTAKLKQNV